jgi:hypothetical protein
MMFRFLCVRFLHVAMFCCLFLSSSNILKTLSNLSLMRTVRVRPCFAGLFMLIVFLQSLCLSILIVVLLLVLLR